MSAPPRASNRFSLRVPPSWVQFDIRRATRTGELTRIVDDHLAKLPNLKSHRRVILKALRRFAEEAESAGAVLCAAAVDEQGPDGALLATLTVFVTEGMPEPALNTVPAIAAQLPATPRPDPGPDPDTDDARESDWREVRIIEIPAGEAVRVRSVTTLAGAADAEPVRLVSMDTLLPLPGQDRILNVVLTSPHVNLVDELLEVFDLISETVAWEDTPGIP